MSIFELNRRLANFSLSEEAREVILDTKDEISELNRGQLFIGVRADGSPITPDYSDFTIELKKAKGQDYDRVTLRDTGDFWNSIRVDVNSKTFTIDATDYKTNKLINKYGKKILGLSADSKSEYRENYFFPALRDKIRRKLGV